MGDIRVDDNQSGGDAVLAVQLQEFRDRQGVSVREVAGRWEIGLRSLAGLLGVTGLVGAPLAVERIGESTQVVVGVLLGMALLATGVGLVLTMSAAYGTARLVAAPQSRTELQTLRWSLAERDRNCLVWGRRLAVGAFVLFAVSVAIAWVDPARDGEATLVEIVTDSGVIGCGRLQDAPHGAIAIETDGDGRVELPASEMAGAEVVADCDEAS